jgi:hypothetical protein
LLLESWLTSAVSGAVSPSMIDPRGDPLDPRNEPLASHHPLPRVQDCRLVQDTQRSSAPRPVKKQQVVTERDSARTVSSCSTDDYSAILALDLTSIS